MHRTPMGIEYFLDPHNLLFQLVYPLSSFVVCMLIYLKTKDIEALSMDKGVKYFRRAFLFLGISFPIMFLLLSAQTLMMEAGQGYLERGRLRDPPGLPLGMLVSRYFLLASGLYLLYSLLWKRVEHGWDWLTKKEDTIIHATALALTISELYIGPFHGTLFSLGLFGYLTLESYANWRNTNTKKRTLPWYPLSLFLLSVMWLVQLAALLFRGASPLFRAYALLSTPLVLSIILYLTHKATRGA